MSKYVPLRVACGRLGVHANTIRRWADSGQLPSIRTQGNQRLFDIDSYLKEKEGEKRRKICYCRVSSHKQRDDLERQVEFMRRRYPNHEIITDIGSGLNFKRKGLISILDWVSERTVCEIVVAHRDRLVRFGFDLIEWFGKKFSCEIVVLDENKLSPTEELTRDLLSIIHVFSCRMHGLRKYQREIKEDKDIPKPTTNGDSEEMDGNGSICV
ncbi:IS607 family transposase [Scytonema sp. PRP1]|uniref:IS607 family transposase n=1 Tax=Scytonema sp. PRP1 TaxID=3120513 RepID=UPI002FD235D4